MTAKITVLEQKTFEGKPSGFKVTLDNGTQGNLQEKESDKGLRVGDEVAVTLIPYTSKKGVTSNLLGLRLVTGGQAAPQQSLPTAPRQAQTLSPRQELTTSMKFDARLKCIQIAHDAFLAGKLDDKEAQTHCREWVVMSDALIDDLSK
jgi:hypothetical protein